MSKRKTIEEKIEDYLNKEVNEKGPISNEKNLHYVFKMPTEGTFTAEFPDDNTKVEVSVDPEDECAGKFALIAKSSGRPMECWDEKPSKEQVRQRLKELKFFG